MELLCTSWLALTLSHIGHRQRTKGVDSLQERAIYILTWPTSTDSPRHCIPLRYSLQTTDYTHDGDRPGAGGVGVSANEAYH